MAVRIAVSRDKLVREDPWEGDMYTKIWTILKNNNNKNSSKGIREELRRLWECHR